MTMTRLLASALLGALMTVQAQAVAQQAGTAPVATPLPKEVRATVEALREAGLADEDGLSFVEDLTTEIGPRLAGSDAEARARDWSSRRLSAMGFDTVRVEGFSIPYWSRLSESASVVSPNPQPLVVTALGGSGATPEGGITAPVARFTSLEALAEAADADVAGKIVFLDELTTRTQDGSGYGVGVVKRRNCARDTLAKGGLACLIRSVGTQPRRFAHTGMMLRTPAGGAGGALGDGPGAALSPPDADQLARLLARGEVTVRLDIQVEARANAPSGNVIAELTGRESPQEIVLIGCHLDSWDSATGALDDAAGCGIVVGAANLIRALPVRPKRTIRVVLYGAEEVGLLGADAYARRHAEDLKNHVLAAESDFGAGPIWRFQTRFGEGAIPHALALQGALKALGVGPGDNRANGGPDIGILRVAGVPVVTPQQDGRDYFDYHHTPDDTFDKIDPESFRQNVAVYAVFTWLAAEMGWDFRAGVAGAP